MKLINRWGFYLSLKSIKSDSRTELVKIIPFLNIISSFFFIIKRSQAGIFCHTCYLEYKLGRPLKGGTMGWALFDTLRYVFQSTFSFALKDKSDGDDDLDRSYKPDTDSGNLTDSESSDEPDLDIDFMVFLTERRSHKTI